MQYRKACALWEISWYTQCMTSQPRCRTNRGRYNRVQLYDFWAISSGKSPRTCVGTVMSWVSTGVKKHQVNAHHSCTPTRTSKYYLSDLYLDYVFIRYVWSPKFWTEYLTGSHKWQTTNFTIVWYYGIQIKHVIPAMEVNCGAKCAVKKTGPTHFEGIKFLRSVKRCVKCIYKKNCEHAS
jgi:hypothetical protein